MYRSFLLSIGTLGALLAALVVYSAPATAEPVFPETVSYQGTIETTTGSAVNSHGGTVLLTFTPERALLRVELRDFVYGMLVLPDYHEELHTIDRTMHYNDASPSPDGTFAGAIPLSEIGMAGRSSLVIRGVWESERQISGNVEVSCSPVNHPVCDLRASFQAEPVETPPEDTDWLVEASVDGGGTLLLALNAKDQLSALALHDVPYGDCYPDYSFNTVWFRNTLQTFPVDFRVDQYYFVRASGARSEDGRWSGTLHFQYSIYGDCPTDVSWSSAGSAPPGATPRPTTTPALKLPVTGSGGSRGDTPPTAYALLVLAGVTLSVATALSLSRR